MALTLLQRNDVPPNILRSPRRRGAQALPAPHRPKRSNVLARRSSDQLDDEGNPRSLEDQTH